MPWSSRCREDGSGCKPEGGRQRRRQSPTPAPARGRLWGSTPRERRGRSRGRVLPGQPRPSPTRRILPAVGDAPRPLGLGIAPRTHSVAFGRTTHSHDEKCRDTPPTPCIDAAPASPPWQRRGDAAGARAAATAFDLFWYREHTTVAADVASPAYATTTSSVAQPCCGCRRWPRP